MSPEPWTKVHRYWERSTHLLRESKQDTRSPNTSNSSYKRFMTSGNAVIVIFLDPLFRAKEAGSYQDDCTQDGNGGEQPE